MAESSGATSIAIAAIGLIGAIIAGIVGYETGSKAVDKDYVQIATGFLARKDTTPELRKWSVDVLSELSPVPFGAKLKAELTQSGPVIVVSRLVVPKPFEIPKGLEESCPDLLKGSGNEIGDELALKVLKQYERCRLKDGILIKFMQDMHSLDVEFAKEAKMQEAKLNAGIKGGSSPSN